MCPEPYLTTIMQTLLLLGHNKMRKMENMGSFSRKVEWVGFKNYAKLSTTWTKQATKSFHLKEQR